MLTQLLIALVLIPLIGVTGCMLIQKKWERGVFTLAMTTILLELVTFLVFGYQWINGGASPVSASIGDLYASHHYTFSLDFYFDKLSAVFLGMATLTTVLIFVFSKYYMHREQGFKRFYNTLLLFFIGLSFIILSGNFEVLLLGWEFIGMASVLLIAFYRDRFLPARNALKVFSVYRIADVFLLGAIWYGHHLFVEGVHFAHLSALVAQYGNQFALLGFLLFMAALIKSAQFPFSYWLPRAMEGPTSSSAIFYGALSVHMGLFLLLRTYPLWEGSVGLRIGIALLGLVTGIAATSIARVQSSIKTQIAYASVTQIGIMFIEVALGLYWLALIHFISNAFLRMYQLLISPSIVSYLVHDQFFYFVPPAQRIKNTLLGKLRATVYILSIKEWNMNTAMNRFLWRPLKSLGRVFAFLDKPSVQAVSFVLFLGSAIVASTALSTGAILVASTAAAVVSIAFYVRAYATKNSARLGWNLIMLGHLFGVIFLCLASGGDWKYLVMYGVGVAVAFAAGHVCLWYLQARGGESLILRDYHGLIYAFKKLGNMFFIICLLFMAFPISPSFLGQEILVSFIPGDNVFQVVLFCLTYLLAGVSIMRLYTKVFFGPHKTSSHEVAYRSS